LKIPEYSYLLKGNLWEMRGSHDSECEDGRSLGCDVMWLGEKSPTFLRKLLPSFSGANIARQ